MSLHEAERFAGWSAALRHARLTRSGVSSLLWNGKAKPQDHGMYRIRYAVQVSGMRAIEISRADGANPSFHLPMQPNAQQVLLSPSLLRQLEKMAVRALYTLGLSSGEVQLVSGGGDRKYAVEKVTPSVWIESKRLQRLYRRTQNKHERSLELELNDDSTLLLGMDPEFLILDSRDRAIVPASRFLDKEGEVGCDAVHGDGVTTYPIAELRPLPSAHPRELLVGLMRTMRMAGEMIRDRSLLWVAGGMPKSGLPLGGHLHFSGIPLTAELLRTLDNYLTLPVSVLEAPTSQQRRPKYGFLGDFRRQPHGGFEYRTLPSFLVSPLLTKGIVYLAYLIVTQYRTLNLRPLDDDDSIHRAYYQGDRERIKECVAPLMSDIRALDRYKDAEDYIEPLFRQIREGGIWNEYRDIRPLWNIPFQP
ncbi:putative amidoligase domain-containing protein [Paenibacillus sp. SAF-054]|uniref:putative amidoligase domain-containing protein n=1 Tax=unclassified Paenibacillus TaxID=185978 RepID=UPI003F7DC4D5